MKYLTPLSAPEAFMFGQQWEVGCTKQPQGVDVGKSTHWKHFFQRNLLCLFENRAFFSKQETFIFWHFQGWTFCVFWIQIASFFHIFTSEFTFLNLFLVILLCFAVVLFLLGTFVVFVFCDTLPPALYFVVLNCYKVSLDTSANKHFGFLHQECVCNRAEELVTLFLSM